MQREELQRSFFYPACGLDLQPLLRFSHLCDTFIFVDRNRDIGGQIQGELEKEPYRGRLGVTNGRRLISQTRAVPGEVYGHSDSK